MITERIVLDEQVSGPAAKAAAGVRELATALKSVGPDGVKAANALAALTRAQNEAAGGRAGIAAKIKADAAAQASASKKAASDAKAAAKEFSAAEKSKAKAAQDAAKAIAKAAKDEEKAEKAVAKETAKAAKEAAKAAKAKGGSKTPVLPRTLESGFGSSASTIVGSVLTAEAIQAAARAALDAVVSIVKSSVAMAAEMAVFKDNALRGLTILTGSAKAAKQAFEDGQKLAREIGGSPVERIGQLQRLIGTFGSERAIQLMKAVADIGVIAPEANIDTVVQSISQIKGLGKTSFEEIKQISESGALSIDEIYSALGRKLGKSTEEIAKLISAGKIDSDTGILGILDAIEKKTGKKLGQAAAEAQNSIGRLYDRLLNAPADIFLSMEGGGSGHLQKQLQSLVATLDPTTESGKKLVKQLEGLRDAGDNLFDNQSGAELQANALRMLTELIEGLKTGFEDVKPVVDATFATLAAMTGADDQASAMRGLGEAVAYASAAFIVFGTVALGPFVWIAKKIGETIDGIRGFSAAAHAAGMSVGEAIVRGLLAALTGGLSEVLRKGAELAAAAITGGNSPAGADVHSPSRKSAETARQIVAGHLQEYKRGMGPVAVAGAALAAASAGASANVGGGASRAPSFSLGGSGGNVTIVVNIGGGAAPTTPAAAQVMGQQVGRAAYDAWMRRRREAA